MKKRMAVLALEGRDIAIRRENINEIVCDVSTFSSKALPTILIRKHSSH